MSYDIYIGNAEIEIIRGYEEEPDYYDIHVPRMEQADAPCFVDDDLTKNENHRHPGYLQWSRFCERAGLDKLFFDKEEGLMRSHPGNAALRKEHHEVIRKTLQKWQKKYPNATPQFGGSDEEAILARLIWLNWWVEYALVHCERPCIENH